MEISSHSLALNRVDHLTVNTAIYTNLSSEHLDFHGDIESYFQDLTMLHLYEYPNSVCCQKVNLAF